MSDYSKPNQRTEEQAKALAEAASLIINVQHEAVAIVQRAGAELLPEESGWFGRPCGAELEPPPENHRCGCRDYKGDGREICLRTYIDFTGPDLGSGPPRRTCRHLPDEHLET